MTQSHHADHHENSAEANTDPADHPAHVHEAPASAPLFEGSGPKDWEEQFGPSVAILINIFKIGGFFIWFYTVL